MHAWTVSGWHRHRQHASTAGRWCRPAGLTAWMPARRLRALSAPARGLGLGLRTESRSGLGLSLGLGSGVGLGLGVGLGSAPARESSLGREGRSMAVRSSVRGACFYLLLATTTYLRTYSAPARGTLRESPVDADVGAHERRACLGLGLGLGVGVGVRVRVRARVQG